MKLPHHTPEDSISLPPLVDFRDPDKLWVIEVNGEQIALDFFKDEL